MKNPTKELYGELRKLSAQQLWTVEVPRFAQGTPAEREARVALIRALGVVYSESGTPAQKAMVRDWLRPLLQDPSEKIRRYTMAALPKLGGGPAEEAELLTLLRKTDNEREKKFLAKSLEKVGGAASLQDMAALLPHSAQKIQASVARAEAPSSIQFSTPIPLTKDLRIHLRTRGGLEEILASEVEAYIQEGGQFRMLAQRTGLVSLAPTAPFSLADLYRMRCFGTVSFMLGGMASTNAAEDTDGLARIITSPLAKHIFQTLTAGSVRYRLDFVTKGHQRAAVRDIAARAFQLDSSILNDAQTAPWTVAIRQGSNERYTVELTPKILPDPRFVYREADLPASSHPPLAAAMARLAGPMLDEVVWDPFCGSGLELIERALLGNVKAIHGTDISPEAIRAAQKNFAASGLTIPATFSCADFRQFSKNPVLRPNSLSLIVTNPPMGKRVPVENLAELITSMQKAAVILLRPGGRLIFANPLLRQPPPKALRLLSWQEVDFGGFDCRLEKYEK